ncbi:MAG: sulfatase, partial [Acidobacteria bacterium]|nr:sulfatase [Acidobacteriota bacterium]
MLRRTLLKSLAAAPAALPSRAQGGRKPNVILISLDQLHADRLHCYGNPRATSPNLDRMAAEGVRLSHFYADSPWTTPSYGAIMTSQYPSRHGATLFFPPGVPGLKPEAITLAELFKKGGYKTAAFVNNSVAGAFVTGRGFDEYDEAQKRPTNITERTTLANQAFRAPATNQRVFKWLEDNARDPFFLFLLYFEPHSPYDPPPEHDLFKNDAYPEATNTGYDVQKGALFRKANLRDQKAIERLYQLYDGKIHFIDYYIGQLLDRLRSNGMEGNTIVLLTSDHGELIYQHPALRQAA